MQKPKAMFFDLDGTLLDERGKVREANLLALEKAGKAGILIGLSTGRDVNSVESLLPSWGIDSSIDLIVGTGGAEVYDRRSGVRSSAHALDGELIREIMDHFGDMDVNFAIPWKGVLYAPKDDRHIRMLSEADHVPYRVADFDKFLEKPRPKVMLVTDPEGMAAVIERAKTFSNEQYKSAALQTASVLYEYMDPEVSKPSGIRTALEPYGIGLDEIWTFGDADNDYEMTKAAGFGIAMGNASGKTRDAADLVIGENSTDTIAETIGKIL